MFGSIVAMNSMVPESPTPIEGTHFGDPWVSKVTPLALKVASGVAKVTLSRGHNGPRVPQISKRSPFRTPNLSSGAFRIFVSPFSPLLSQISVSLLPRPPAVFHCETSLIVFCASAVESVEMVTAWWPWLGSALSELGWAGPDAGAAPVTPKPLTPKGLRLQASVWLRFVVFRAS